MRRIIILIITSSLLHYSCQRNPEEDYTLKFYGDAYEDAGYSISPLSDGYIIAGQLTVVERSTDGYILNTNRDMGVIRTSKDGRVIWKINSGGDLNDYGRKVIALDDGSFICTGTITVDGGGKTNTDVYVVKISATGNTDWEKMYGGTGNQSGRDIIKTSYGYMILGTTDAERAPSSDSTGNRAGKNDIYLLRISANGDLLESSAYGYPGDDSGEVLKEIAGGKYIILGTTDRSEPGQANNNLILIIVNQEGSIISSLITGGTDDEYAADIEVLDDGYLITGTAGKEPGEQKILLTRLTTNIFAPPVNGFPKKISVNNLSSSARALSAYRDGSFLIAGRAGSGSSSSMLVFEVDGSGNEVAGHSLIRGSTGSQAAFDVASDNDGYIVAVGNNSYEINSMISFLRFRF